jgi:hypothetical protein
MMEVNISSDLRDINQDSKKNMEFRILNDDEQNVRGMSRVQPTAETCCRLEKTNK